MRIMAADKKYKVSLMSSAAMPRSERLRRLGVGGASEAEKSMSFQSVNASGTDAEKSGGARGVKNVLRYYAATASSTEDPDAWQLEKVPELSEENKYLWSFTVTEYTDGTSSRTEPAVISTYGEKGDPGEDAYSVVILPTTANGNIIRNGQGSVTLSASAYKGGADITGSLSDSQFSWRRISDSAESDETWNAAHKGVGRTITVTKEEVYRTVSIECEISA